jgi:hypothetical protein
MRRILRSAFVLLIVATLVAPLQLGDTGAAQLPICCLGQGEHDCMGHMLGGEGLPVVSAPNPCPYAQLALAALHGPNLALPVGAQAIAAVTRSSWLITESHDSFLFSTVDTHQERGPPAFSL